MALHKIGRDENRQTSTTDVYLFSFSLSLSLPVIGFYRYMLHKTINSNESLI